MTATSPGWDLHRSFLAVLRNGSLSGAARSLELTQPTIGRHIAELEGALGVTLFVRSQRGLAPTEAALDLRPHAETMAAAAAALIRASSGASADPEGSVRVTASEIVGVEVLPPILARFRETHPKIVIELALSNLNQDLLRRDADIAVRMARPTQSALIARLMGRVNVGLYAHRAYLDRHGMPANFDDIRHHTLIGFDADAGAIRALRQTGLPITRELFALRSDSDHAQLAALRAGFGIGGCQVGIAANEPDLIPVLPNLFRFELEMWLAMHEDLKASLRVRLLFDHLARELSAYAVRRPRKGPKSGDGQPMADGLYPRTLRRPEAKRVTRGGAAR